MQLDKPCKLWTGCKNEDGYGIRKLWIQGKQVNVRVHREVCIETHGAPPKGKNDARHLCHNRACYEPTHLVWGSRWENMQHAVKAGRTAIGEKNGAAKLNKTAIATIMHGKTRRTKDTRNELAERFGITPQTVSKIWLGQRWRHL
jgi:hypothetical protein